MAAENLGSRGITPLPLYLKLMQIHPGSGPIAHAGTGLSLIHPGIFIISLRKCWARAPTGIVVCRAVDSNWSA